MMLVEMLHAKPANPWEGIRRLDGGQAVLPQVVVQRDLLRDDVQLGDGCGVSTVVG